MPVEKWILWTLRSSYNSLYKFFFSVLDEDFILPTLKKVYESELGSVEGCVAEFVSSGEGPCPIKESSQGNEVG